MKLWGVTRSLVTESARPWRPPRMIESATHRWLIIGGLALYGLLALVTVDIDPARIAPGGCGPISSPDGPISEPASSRVWR